MIGASPSTVRRSLLSTAVRFRPALVLDPLSSLSGRDPSVEATCRSFHGTPMACKNKGFRPRRRPTKDYRPIKPGPKKVVDHTPGNDHKFVRLKPDDGMKAPLGPMGQDVIEGIRRERKRKLLHKITHDDVVEEDLRLMDYLLAEDGSTEDRVGERRALSIDMDTEAEREEFLEKMDQLVRDANLRDLGVDHEFEKEEHLKLLDETKKGKHPKGKNGAFRLPFDERMGDGEQGDQDPEVSLDPNQLAFGDWSEMLITVDRNVKLWRGGRLESYRALVIGGNLNGCGGFGVGKSKQPIEAVAKASRVCKRNIFFVDRYQGDSLTRDLVGKQNNCKVVIRTTKEGLRGNPLAKEILKRFGIVNASIKAYGRRTPYNVVQGTFKALMTHESIEEIALKRGKRLVSLDRAMRLGI